MVRKEPVKSMRNRPSYHYTPARSEVINRKPAPRRPRANWNQILLLLFFIALPFCGLLALFFGFMKWVFIVLSVTALALMWYQRGFNARGRLTMSLLFSVLTVVMLVSALSPQSGVGVNVPVTMSTTPPISYSAPSVVSTPVPTVENIGNDGLTAVDGVQAAATDASMTGTDGTDAQSGAAGSTQAMTQGQQVLEKFMQTWQVAIMADLVPLTPPSWRSAQAEPAQELFWKFQNLRLQSWEYEGSPQGTDADSAQTITVIYDAISSNRQQTFQAQALVVKEDGEWYVDPDSLTGVKIERTTPEPELDYSPLPATPTPVPTEVPTANTLMYYNPDGGKLYHANPECSSVAADYLPLTSFKFGLVLSDDKFSRLEPCDTCDAPPKSALEGE